MSKTNKIVSLYRSGMIAADIARRLGCTPQNVSYVLKHAGFPRRHRGPDRKRRNYPNPKRLDIIALYQFGLSATDIGDVFHISKQAVIRTLYPANPPRLPPGTAPRRPSSRLDHLTPTSIQATPLTNICPKTRLCRQYVRELLHEANRPWRPSDDRRRKSSREYQRWK